MSAEQNIALVRRYYVECANDDDPDKQRALAVADELLSPDFIMYYNNQSAAEAEHGKDKHQAFLVDHARAFRGEHWTVEKIVADKQTLAGRWRVQATHRNGQPDRPARGRLLHHPGWAVG